MPDQKRQRAVRVGADVVDKSTGEILGHAKKTISNIQSTIDNEPVGIACPNCGCRHLETYDSRPLAGGMVRRYKRCRHCGRGGIRTLEKKA